MRERFTNLSGGAQGGAQIGKNNPERVFASLITDLLTADTVVLIIVQCVQLKLPLRKVRFIARIAKPIRSDQYYFAGIPVNELP